MTTLRQLHYFVTVTEEGQLTRAAASLHLSQPALSQAISQLEADLGVELLERHARGVRLTPAGEAFFEKARSAVNALAAVDLTAESLSRAAKNVLECGFVGSPPAVEAPKLFAEFDRLHPAAEISFRDLNFPYGSTASWLEAVDVAVLYVPTPHPEVDTLVLRTEPRVALLSKGHPLAQRDALTVADVLDDTFAGNHPSVERVRAGVWRLDDVRGGPARVTADQASNPLEVLAVVASGRAIWTAPAATAALFVNASSPITMVPLIDASPLPLALAWRKDNRNPHVPRLAAIARELAAAGASPPRAG